MKIFVIQYTDGVVRIAKRSYEEARNWFVENYPHREILDIYEQ